MAAGDSFHFEGVEHFTAGTVGPKGQRAFFLQFGNRGDLVTVKVEKAHVAALAERFDSLLESAPDVAPDDVALALDLIEPVQSVWPVGSMQIGYRNDDNRFVLVLEEFVTEEDEHDAGTAEIVVTPGQITAFIDRARDLVAAGRPPCAYCGTPLNDDDGWCPCWN